MHVSQRAGVHPHDGARDRRRAGRRRAWRRRTRRGHKHVGVWVGERKIASVGVHISHGVSAHGFAVNVDNDLEPFTLGRGLRAAGGADDLAGGRGRAPRASPASASASGIASARRSGAASGSSRRAAGHRAAGRGVMDVGLAIFLTRRRDPTRPCSPARPRRAATSRCSSPSTPTSPCPRGMVARDGGPLDEKYRRTHDPFVALAFAAAATEQLVIGTSVCLVIEHDPIVLAKEVASLRPALRRALRVRRRRRLEQAGDAQPRHRPGDAPRQHARAGRGDEGDLDATTRRPTTASTSTSTRSGSGRSRCTARVAGLHRRQRPARRGPRAALRRRLDAEHEGDRDARAADRRRCASGPAATSRSPTTARRPRTSRRLEAAGVDRALIVLESGPEAEVLASIPSL